MPPLILEPSRAILALRQSRIPALQRLSVEETETHIVISGTVHSYYLKQLAQETVRAIRAGRKIHNRVTVDPDLRAPE